MQFEPKHVDKEWGHETWLANNLSDNYCGKILHIEAGRKFSMHFHTDKHETFYILSGSCKLSVIDTSSAEVNTIELHEGDCYEIDRFVPHQVEAVTDVDIIESSTYHRDEDSYRVWRD